MRKHQRASIRFQSKARFACPPKPWRRRARTTLLACLLAAAFLFAAPAPGFAQDPRAEQFGLGSEFSQVGVQTDRDLKSIIATIINISLGFLGIVAVIIIMYAGYLWMTASGNEEQVARAKSILRNAVIGLVIILMSWGIAAFVINRIGGAIGAGPGGGNGGGGIPPPGGNVAAFVVDSFETSHDGADASQGVQLCSNIQAQFNHWLNTEMVENLKNGDTLTIKRNNGGTFVDEGTILIEKRNNVISFKRIDGEAVDAKGRPVRVDWTPNATYEVRLDETLRDARGLVLSGCADCDGTRDGYHFWTFATGTTRDSVAPSLTRAYPGDGESNVPRSTVFSLEFSEAIDATTVLEPPEGADEDDPAPDELIAENIFLQPRLSDGTYGQAIPSSVFDASFKNNRLVFGLNKQHVAVFDGRPYLEPYTEYRLTIQNIEDLCGNELAPPVEIVFKTGADVPGVSFVRPSDGYEHSCPATPAFVQFRTSMYNVRTQSCGVDPNGFAGLVLGGTLNPAGVTLRTLPEDNFTGTGSPMDYCKQYSFNLDPSDAADDLIPGTEYAASVDFIKPGGDVANPENHAWSFTVAEPGQCANEPYISYISSGLGYNQGRWEQCLTVQGQHLDDPQAISRRAHTALDLESPILATPIDPAVQNAWPEGFTIDLNDRTWSETSIAADFIAEPDPAAQPVPQQNEVDFGVAVSVEHPQPIGTLTSNEVRFTVDTTQTFTGPCLYSINPARGFWGDSVTLSGSNLGSGQGNTLTFYNQKSAAPLAPGLWTSTRIQSRVPDQAQNNPSDGEVHVTVNGVQSNKLEFSLRAGVGQSCSAIPAACSPDPGLCSEGLECSTSSCTCQVPDTFRITGVQPSASCTDSCTSAVISFETSKPIAEIAGSRVQLKKCPGTTQCLWSDAQASLVSASIALDGAQRAVITPQTPGNALDLGSWYLARVLGGLNGVVATDGKTIANLNADTDATVGEDSYVWSFKTGSTACAVNRIELNQSRLGLYEGETTDLAARAYGPANSCAPGGQELVPPDNFAWRACEYVNGDVSFECRQSCDAPLLGGNAIASVAASSSGQSVITGGEGSADGSVKALACAFYDEGSTHLKDGAIATVYAACNTNDDCTRNGQCTGSVCLQDGENEGRCSPTITGFSPESGVAGTWVTINGCYFGNARAQVEIGRDPIGVPAQALAPNAAWCGTTWSDSQIIAEVAPDAINPGPVRVTRPGFDAVSASGSFTPNSVAHPGICRLTPLQGRPNDIVSIRGQGFGAAPGASGSVVFTVGAAPFATTDVVARPARSSCPEDGWENSELCIRVAQAPAGTGTVKVVRGASESNAVSFTVLGTIPPGSGNPNNLAVRSYAPGDGNYACLNMVVEVVLRGQVTDESLGFAPGERLDADDVADANFYVIRTSDRSLVTGVADAITRGSQTTLRLYPDAEELAVRDEAEPPDYQIVLKGGVSGLRSTTGGILATDAVCDELSDADRAAGITDEDCVINFDTVSNSQDDQCRLTHFEIEPVAPIFTCARDGCEGDQDQARPGHQRAFSALPINRAGQSVGVSSPVAWSSSDETVLSEASVSDEPQTVFDVHPVDGATDIAVRANIEGADISGSTEARVLLCENPWPASMAQNGLPFSDTLGLGFTAKDIRTNFSTFYCRDRASGGPLPDLSTPRVEVGRGEERDVSNLLKELFFIQPQSTDAIGVRVLSNTQNLSINDWYNAQEYGGNPASIAPLDGFNALQDGRTIYVAAPNDTDPDGSSATIYNNIYLISVNDNASPDTISIFNQMVSKWRFLVNIENQEDKQKLKDDLVRIRDAHTIASLLQTKQPTLESGSFKQGVSLSTWPSWRETLSADFGTSLPVDPVNDIHCEGTPIDQNTCWNPATQNYVCNTAAGSEESHVYLYKYEAVGAAHQAVAQFNLAYGPSAKWANVLSGSGFRTLAGDACRDLEYVRPIP